MCLCLYLAMNIFTDKNINIEQGSNLDPPHPHWYINHPHTMHYFQSFSPNSTYTDPSGLYDQNNNTMNTTILNRDSNNNANSMNSMMNINYNPLMSNIINYTTNDIPMTMMSQSDMNTTGMLQYPSNITEFSSSASSSLPFSVSMNPYQLSSYKYTSNPLDSQVYVYDDISNSSSVFATATEVDGDGMVGISTEEHDDNDDDENNSTDGIELNDMINALESTSDTLSSKHSSLRHNPNLISTVGTATTEDALSLSSSSRLDSSDVLSPVSYSSHTKASNMKLKHNSLVPVVQPSMTETPTLTSTAMTNHQITNKIFNTLLINHLLSETSRAVLINQDGTNKAVINHLRTMSLSLSSHSHSHIPVAVAYSSTAAASLYLPAALVKPTNLVHTATVTPSGIAAATVNIRKSQTRALSSSTFNLPTTTTSSTASTIATNNSSHNLNNTNNSTTMTATTSNSSNNTITNNNTNIVAATTITNTNSGEMFSISSDQQITTPSVSKLSQRKLSHDFINLNDTNNFNINNANNVMAIMTDTSIDKNDITNSTIATNNDIIADITTTYDNTSSNTNDNITITATDSSPITTTTTATSTLPTTTAAVATVIPIKSISTSNFQRSKNYIQSLSFNKSNFAASTSSASTHDKGNMTNYNSTHNTVSNNNSYNNEAMSEDGCNDRVSPNTNREQQLSMKALLPLQPLQKSTSFNMSRLSSHIHTNINTNTASSDTNNTNANSHLKTTVKTSIKTKPVVIVEPQNIKLQKNQFNPLKESTQQSVKTTVSIANNGNSNNATCTTVTNTITTTTSTTTFTTTTATTTNTINTTTATKTTKPNTSNSSNMSSTESSEMMHKTTSINNTTTTHSTTAIANASTIIASTPSMNSINNCVDDMSISPLSQEIVSFVRQVDVLTERSRQSKILGNEI